MYDKWKALCEIGLTEDLLPCAQPWVLISPGSRVQQLGKTPATINSQGFGSGIPQWSSYRATICDVEKWSSNTDYGICIQTRRLRAIDIDVPDYWHSQAVMARIAELSGWTIPICHRYRNGTGKLLIPVWVDGDFRKHVIRLPEGSGVIEFLGNGQQFIAFGQHPSGGNYEWDGDISRINRLTHDAYIALMDVITSEFGGEAAKPYIARNSPVERRADDLRNDPLVPHLYDNGYVIEDDDLKLYVRCPWEASHTSQSLTSTVYMCGGHNGLPGAFKCLHAHCENYSTYDFMEAVGFSGVKNLPIGSAESDEGANKSESVVICEKVARFNGSMRLTKDGQFKDDMATLVNWLSADGCPIRVRYDEFTAQSYIAHGGQDEYKPIKDVDISRLRVDLQNRYNFVQVRAGTASDAVDAVAHQNNCDSAVDWINSLQWDGVLRVANFLADYAGCELNEYSTLLSQYIFAGFAARALNTKQMVRITPILISAQEYGKTSLLRALVPMSSMYASISMSMSDDDLARHLRGVLLAEWEEVRGASTREISAFKAFTSKVSDKWVPKYKEFADEYTRRFVMIGTNNPGRFLSDPTGHTRFAPIKLIHPTRWQEIPVIRDQLWAEGAALFRDGGIPHKQLSDYLTANIRLYDEFTIIDAWEPRVRAYIANNPDADNDCIFIECLGKGIEGCRIEDVRRLENIKTRIKGGL